MIARFLAMYVITCILVMGQVSLARAAGDTRLGAEWLAKVQDYETRVQDARAALQSQETIGAAQLNSYLRDVAWMVYFALDAYSFDNHDVPDDLHSLVDEGYLKTWPLNPLDEWQPIKVLSASDPFTPGALVVQWAPEPYMSIVGPIDNYKLRPLSYEVAVYGLTEESPAYGPDTPSDTNPWARPLDGVVIMLGSTRESADQTIYKIRRRLAKQTHASEGSKK